MNSSDVAKLVSEAIADYTYQVPPNLYGLYGKPWSHEKVAEQLILLDAALIVPVLQPFELRDTAQQSKSTPVIVMDYWLVANDKSGYLVFYDEQQSEFGLGCTDYVRLPETIGVRGGLVSVFMAR